MNGDLTVQGFVTALAQSETYKRLFLEPSNPYRLVELNFKHLLGRAPHDQEEVMAHVRLMNEEGFEAEIVSYTYSEEYLRAFGVDTVPYNRSKQSMTGGRTINFARADAVDAGFAGFDGAETDSKLLTAFDKSCPQHHRSQERRQRQLSHHHLELRPPDQSQPSCSTALCCKPKFHVRHHSRNPLSGRSQSFPFRRLNQLSSCQPIT